MPRRLAITAPYELQIINYEDAPLQPDQVLVKTELASGKHGTTTALFDNGAFKGKYFDQPTRLFLDAPDDIQPNLPTPDAPWNMGTTGVGTIIAVGEKVTRWKVGDRVFGTMDVRETNICAENRLWALGDVDPYLALCIEPSYVSFHCIRESNLRYGDSVAIVGLGALGLLAVSMAREAGAENVIAIDLLESRRKLADDLGADHTIDPRAEDAALAVHQLTGGPGVDVAIELGGAYQALNTAIRSARIGGTICSAGFYQSEASGMWLGREWHHNRLTMIVPHGCGWGHVPRDFPRWDNQRAYDTIASMMHKGRLKADGIINMTLPFERATGVFELIRDKPQEVIKYAVRFA